MPLNVLEYVRLCIHSVAVVQFSYGIYYFCEYVKFPASNKIMSNPYGGKFKYLTFINVIVQTIYYSICVINDLIGTYEVAPRKVPVIRKIKDYMLATFAFPLAMNVSISFWWLYAIDRELVLPKESDSVFPGWLNHIMHTTIAVFIILEMFTSYRSYPSRTKGLTGLSIFMLAYMIWIHIIKHNSGLWVYPVLDVMPMPQRIVFFIAVIAFTLFLYIIGEWMNNTIWAKELKLLQRKSK